MMQMLSVHTTSSFSAHMLLHVLLLLVVGPLLVLFRSPVNDWFRPAWKFLRLHPVVGWLTGMGVMWLWHVPGIFNAVMGVANGPGKFILSGAEVISLVVAGMFFSAPVMHYNRQYRVNPLQGVLYLFTACTGCSLLGLLITFAPAGTYHHHPVTIADQQAAGLIMWVPCCLVYVTAAMYLLAKWFNQKDTVTTI